MPLPVANNQRVRDIRAVEIEKVGVLLSVSRTARYSSACGNAGESLLRAGFAVSELIAAKNNSNEAGDFGDRPCEQGLHGGKACVKG